MKPKNFSLLIILVFSLFLINSFGQYSSVPACDDHIVEKVKTAMLCMQRYSWEHGTAMQGMLEIGDTGHLIIIAREAVQRKTPDGRLSMVGSDMNIADPGVNGPGVLAAYNITGDAKYKTAAEELYEYLNLPSSKNVAGIIYHNNKSKVIFSDNMFMVAPFMALMKDYDEAMHQIEGIRNLLWNEEKNLFHHIRIQETMEFKDKSFWGGGNGWCAAGMAQVIDMLPGERETDRQKLIRYCTDLLDGCIANQLPGGLLYDKITEPNFEETTLPAMLAYTIYTGIRSGWLDASYMLPADKMRTAIYANVDEFGLMQNASKAPRFNSPGTSTEGQAFFLMMEGAFRKLKSQLAENSQELIDVWNTAKLRERGPILIAHRGGVVGKGIPECSKLAVRMAAIHYYDMVELDVQESKDHYPVVFHDRNMKHACGMDKRIADFSLEELSEIKFLNSEETISSLDTILSLCRSLNLGVMFDIKQGERSDLYFERLLALMDKYGLNKACMTIGDSHVQERLRGKALLTISGNMLDKVKKGKSIDLHGYFWFGVPTTWPLELVKPVQEKGGLVVPALNIFRYSEEQHREEARMDAERLLKAGADGFQIDCVYQDYFGRPKDQQETKSDN